MTSLDRDRLAAEYVLGSLEPAEQAAAEQLLGRESAFRDAVARWHVHFASLDATARPEPAPEGLWSRIEADIAAGPVVAAAPLAVVDVRAAFRSLWASLPFWRMAGLAGAAASFALAIGLAMVGARPAPPVLVAVLVTDDNRPAAVVNAFADGHADLVPLEPIPVPPGRALQIWTLWDRARGPVSLGLLDRARSVRIELDRIPRPGPNQLFEITLEPETGSPTGRPTGPILMKGLTSQAL